MIASPGSPVILFTTILPASRGDRTSTICPILSASPRTPICDNQAVFVTQQSCHVTARTPRRVGRKNAGAKGHANPPLPSETVRSMRTCHTCHDARVRTIGFPGDNEKRGRQRQRVRVDTRNKKRRVQKTKIKQSVQVGKPTPAGWSFPQDQSRLRRGRERKRGLTLVSGRR